MLRVQRPRRRELINIFRLFQFNLECSRCLSALACLIVKCQFIWTFIGRLLTASDTFGKSLDTCLALPRRYHHIEAKVFLSLVARSLRSLGEVELGWKGKFRSWAQRDISNTASYIELKSFVQLLRQWQKAGRAVDARGEFNANTIFKFRQLVKREATSRV